MTTRQHVHEEVFPVAPEQLFKALHTSSAIRKWWGAARVIVLPQPGGAWAATWGEDEDDPDYTIVATIHIFDPPERMVLTDYRYRAKSGPLPFEEDFKTEFSVASHSEGSLLRVSQDGFPASPEADAYFDECRKGWRDTFAGIRKYLTEAPEKT